MPRKERLKSISGIYHVVMKGVNDQDIFTVERDFYKFIDILKACQEKDHFDIFAYCLMSNHVHILIRVHDKTIGEVMHRIGTNYAVWFNKKHERVGHLYKDRFFSKPVDRENYFVTVFRYVLQNPMKAGLEKYPGEKYRWTNARVFYGKSDDLTEVAFVSKYFNSRKELLVFLNYRDVNDEYKMNILSGERIKDETAAYIVRVLCSRYGVEEFCELKREEQIELVGIMHKRYNMPLNLICRVTGMGYKFVKKYGDGEGGEEFASR